MWGSKRDKDVKNRLLDSVGEGKVGMIWENSTETCILSYVKQIASLRSMHETGCSGLVRWDDPEGWDGWMASLTRWTWVWVNSGRWWWTGRPGVLRFMGSQRVRHDWATELNLHPYMTTGKTIALTRQTFVGFVGLNIRKLIWNIWQILEN